MQQLTSENREEWEKPEYWNKICEHLSVEDDSQEAKYVSDDAFWSHSQNYKTDLLSKGYALVDQSLPNAIVVALKDGVEKLVEASYPASFIFLFDETWHLARYSRRLLEKSTSNPFHYDLLAWYIDEGGFSPHRDRQPEDVASSFHPDGEAKFATHWIALTPATTSNSCLYMIPKDHDPGYTKGDEDEKDPLSLALPNKEAFQRIRAMPRDSGQSILFTHRIIHWGSIKDPEATPRAAISFVCSDPSFEKPYVDPAYFTDARLPPFSIRLLLVCAQLIIYHQRFQLSKSMLKACFELCKSMEDKLEKTYWHKVAFEYVEAMKEDAQTNELDESEEEEMMELMLKAEQSGYGEYSDDYDEGSNEIENGADAEDDDFSDEEEGALLFRTADGCDDNDTEGSVASEKHRKRQRTK
ncbi:hypothetical protein FisN_3Hh449 [Fistulifera solaris]|uniref:Phytanoyl-CoA dioxygenase n=1 Tax=Fistulifera solaris TaxID=1519565 RepID=A0A1Z5K849_FISSO|nr:hypothetical protein FisN_3Hh449 [Fistulifera solaris]|eukprot:GAX22345.1 hypothetical protein FisN_3Hh449 [Fistulifera solaris]